MPRVLKPKTDVYSIRIPLDLKEKVKRMTPEQSQALAIGVVKQIQKQTKSIENDEN